MANGLFGVGADADEYEFGVVARTTFHSVEITFHGSFKFTNCRSKLCIQDSFGFCGHIRYFKYVRMRRPVL